MSKPKSVKKRKQKLLPPPKGKDLITISPAGPVPERVTQQKVENYLRVMGLANKLEPNEVKLFVEIAVAFNLNPFKREVYCIVYKNQDGERTLSIVTGFEVYLKRAEKSGRLSGWKVWTEGDGPSMKAIIEIRRRDWGHPFTHEVLLKEYSTGKKMWNTKPATMIKKVAMSQGFRLAFPETLEGMPYTPEELNEIPDGLEELPPLITEAEVVDVEAVFKEAENLIESSQRVKQLTERGNEIKKIVEPLPKDKRDVLVKAYTRRMNELMKLEEKK